MHELISDGRGYMSNEIVNAQYDYTPAEIDLFVKIMAKLKRAKTPAEKELIRLSYLELLPDSDSNRNYEYLRKCFRGLLTKPIEVFYRESNEYYLSNVLADVTIKKNNGLILVRINPKMATILTDTGKQYTGYEIASLLSLKSKFSKRLYLMACQFRSTGIKFINIPDLKKSLKIGMGHYEDTHDFIRRVIIPSVQEITAKTELECTFEKIKAGRNIDQLCITVKLTTQAAEVWGNDKQIAYMLNRCKLAAWQVEQVCEAMRPDEIHPILLNVQKNIAHIKNPGAYLAKVFEDHGVIMHKKINRQIPINYEQPNNTAAR